MNKLLFTAIIASMSTFTVADEPQIIKVLSSSAAPTIDGDLSEWAPESFHQIAIATALEDDDKNSVVAEDIQLAAQVVGSNVYFAVRWKDESESISYRPWRWTSNKYKKSKTRDDMFALRFEMSGDYNRSMIADANYSVDVWAWSSARSNLIGHADDLIHRISTDYIENAAEYATPSGKMIFIDRDKDEGTLGYDNYKPDLKVQTEKSVDSIQVNGPSTGSIGDVKAKGIWKDGFWHLEMTRALNTGNDDDKAFEADARILSQVAVFDENYEEHKSVSEPLLLVFP